MVAGSDATHLSTNVGLLFGKWSMRMKGGVMRLEFVKGPQIGQGPYGEET